jgi:hypothetical protein
MNLDLLQCNSLLSNKLASQVQEPSVHAAHPARSQPRFAAVLQVWKCVCSLSSTCNCFSRSSLDLLLQSIAALRAWTSSPLHDSLQLCFKAGARSLHIAALLALLLVFADCCQSCINSALIGLLLALSHLHLCNTQSSSEEIDSYGVA